jgi:hypothetical protein
MFTGSGGPLTTILEVSEGAGTFGGPSLNNSGVVAFPFTAPGMPRTILTGSGGPLTPSASLFEMNGICINNAGTVSFSADGVYTGSGGPLTRIVDDSLFAFFLRTSINDRGGVAFHGDLRAPGIGLNISGIFTGPDPVADKVIAEGDPLFGSTVEGPNINFGIEALNNKGQIAFGADLADGTRGVFVATPVIGP